MKKVFVAWKQQCTRSENQAKHFDATMHYIFPRPRYSGLLQLANRYLRSTIQTWRMLAEEKPDIIFCLNQPPFLIGVVFAFSLIHRAGYILDSHSAAFNDPKWAWFRPAYRIIAKRALVNINTNQHHKALVESWGGTSVVIGDVPIDHSVKYDIVTTKPNSILFVASYMFDEPIEQVIEAARLCPEAHFYFTGDSRKLQSTLLESAPANVTFTGYLSRDDYLALMASVDAVMALTTRDHTMQMGAYEALSLGIPIVTSDWDILRESFGDSAIYVGNHASSIAKGLRELLSRRTEMRENAARQRSERRQAFEIAKQKIQQKCEPFNGIPAR